MSKFRNLATEALSESYKELEEGRFGKFLGTMATAAAIGLGASGDASGAFNRSLGNIDNQPIVKTQNGAEVPEWVKNKSNIVVNNGKMTFTAEIDVTSDQPNMNVLRQIAANRAGNQLFQNLSEIINEKLSQMDLEEIDTESTIGGILTNNYFWLVTSDEGSWDYHTYAQVQIPVKMVDSTLAKAIYVSNPNLDLQTIKKLVTSAINEVVNNGLYEK